jgi:hypothetical protein
MIKYQLFTYPSGDRITSDILGLSDNFAILACRSGADSIAEVTPSHHENLDADSGATKMTSISDIH